MKKFTVSAILILAFSAYVTLQRIVGNGNSAPINSTNTAVSTGITPPAIAPVPVANPVTIKPVISRPYKDGRYTGVSADAYYGNIQVQAIITGGKLTDVVFLDYPQDRNTSIRVNTQAMPILKQEAIQAQNANVDTVSGATDSSGAFRQSLGSALALAKN